MNTETTSGTQTQVRTVIVKSSSNCARVIIAASLMACFIPFITGCLQSEEQSLDALVASEPKLHWSPLGRPGQILTISSIEALNKVIEQVELLDGLDGVRMQIVPITDDQLSFLKRLDLKILAINGSKLTDEGLKSIGELESLRNLSIHCYRHYQGPNAITDKGLAALGNLPNLERLLITGASSMTGSGLDSWSSTDSLTDLALVLCDLGDENVDSILRFKNLEKIGLTETNITLDGILRLAELENLKGIRHPNRLLRDRKKRFGFMRQYNREYIRLHGQPERLPYSIPEDPQF